MDLGDAGINGPLSLHSVKFVKAGIYVVRRWHRPVSLAYGEILTAERLGSGLGLRLHTKGTEPVRILCRGAGCEAIEDELRSRGVRVVDEWGAIITPTLNDFVAELAREPVRMRQSSDNA